MRLVPRWPRPMSLRARIALAFAVLVLTSATCTILIGNAIFGRKARELARARLELDLQVIGEALRAHQALLAGLAASLGRQLERDGSDPGPALCEAGSGLPFDFLATVDSGRRRAVLVRDPRCLPILLEGERAQALLASFSAQDSERFVAAVKARKAAGATQ